MAIGKQNAAIVIIIISLLLFFLLHSPHFTFPLRVPSIRNPITYFAVIGPIRSRLAPFQETIIRHFPPGPCFNALGLLPRNNLIYIQINIDLLSSVVSSLSRNLSGRIDLFSCCRRCFFHV